MARGVHQVEDIILAVLGPVVEPHGLGLDGDPALAFQFEPAAFKTIVEKAKSTLAS